MSKKSDALSDFSGLATVLAMCAPDNFPDNGLYGTFEEEIEEVYRLWHNYKSCLKQDLDRANELEKMLDESIALMRTVGDEDKIGEGIRMIQRMTYQVEKANLK